MHPQVEARAETIPSRELVFLANQKNLDAAVEATTPSIGCPAWEVAARLTEVMLSASLAGRSMPRALSPQRSERRADGPPCAPAPWLSGWAPPNKWQACRQRRCRARAGGTAHAGSDGHRGRSQSRVRGTRGWAGSSPAPSSEKGGGLGNGASLAASAPRRQPGGAFLG